MYELLADTYDLTKDERDVLSELGKYAGAEGAGTEQWVAKVIGGSAFKTYETLSMKLGCENDAAKMEEFAFWYRTGNCPLVIVDVPENAMCPSVNGCRRTMGIGMFPFWPTDLRCTDCIRDAVRPRKSLEKQRTMGKKLRDLLVMNQGENTAVPHMSHVIGGVCTNLGGTEAVVKEYAALLQDEGIKPGARLKHYETFTKLIGVCNELERQQANDRMSLLDKYDPEQLGQFIVGLLAKNATKEQTELILGSVEDIPQCELALVDG